jgi:hypothetical protein
MAVPRLDMTSPLSPPLLYLILNVIFLKTDDMFDMEVAYYQVMITLHYEDFRLYIYILARRTEP